MPPARRIVIGLLLSASFVCGQVQTAPPAGDDKKTPNADASAAEPSDPPAAEAPAAVPASPLVWWNREIIIFRSTTAKLSPKARSHDALLRIQEFSDLLLEKKVTTERAEVQGESAIRFLVDGNYLFSLLPSDLDPLSGESAEEESEIILEQLEKIRQARIEQSSAEAIAKGITAAVIATVVFFAVIFVLRIVTLKVSKFVETRVRRWRRLKLRRADLRPHIGLLGKQFIKVLAFFLGLYLFCIWIAFVFNQFPLTEPLGAAFTGRLLDFAKGILLSMVGAIPGLATAVLILFITRWLARLIDQVIRSMGDDENGIMARDTAKATRRISVAAVWIIGIVLSYPYLPGSGSDAFKGISVLLGLMVSLGSSGMINQIMSGFVLLYSGSVRTGEYVKIGEIEGTVTEMGILAVKFLTPSGEYMTIPNAVMIGNPSTNYTRLCETTGVPITSVVTIGYDAPWRQVHELLISAAKETAGIEKHPAPRVIQNALSDWYAEYTLIGYAAAPEMRTPILSELNGKIQDAFNEAGIQIMSPHYQKDPPEPLVIPKERWFPGGPEKK
ncbi:mechanosensitive ion channel protein MscS [Oceaniferula spumae]|uniref:Mechanosensitive ion channel protein MscS n=1 Tax=Oceaniferula spumae TaxID=2979115 RepID=A0AAT9FKL1_9BACT